LGHNACREDLSVLYYRMPRLFTALALARGDGRYANLLRSLARVDLLILDDWGPEIFNADQRRDLLEIVARTAMTRARSSSPVRRASIHATPSPAIRLWPMPFSTASSTMPTASSFPARACARQRRRRVPNPRQIRRSPPGKRKKKAAPHDALRF